jgi:ferritin
MENIKILKPIKLPEDVVNILNERIRDEYTAHYFYRNATNWCKDANYVKAAKFFEEESNTELEHAKILQDYITSWNVIPTIPPVNPGVSSFKNLVEIVNSAYKMEYNLLVDYNETSSKLFSIDLTTFDFLQQFRTGQKESVSEYSDLLNALELVDVNNKFEILYFENNYFN